MAQWFGEVGLRGGSSEFYDVDVTSAICTRDVRTRASWLFITELLSTRFWRDMTSDRSNMTGCDSSLRALSVAVIERLEGNEGRFAQNNTSSRPCRVCRGLYCVTSQFKNMYIYHVIEDTCNAPRWCFTSKIVISLILCGYFLFYNQSFPSSSLQKRPVYQE